MGSRAEEGQHFRLESQEMVPEEGSFEPGLTEVRGHRSQVGTGVGRAGNGRRKLLRQMQKAGSQQARAVSAAREGFKVARPQSLKLLGGHWGSAKALD